MKHPRYSTSRQKACNQCSNAKVRCDRRAGGCVRCAQRGKDCQYASNLRPKIPIQNVSCRDVQRAQAPLISSGELIAAHGLHSASDASTVSNGDSGDLVNPTKQNPNDDLGPDQSSTHTSTSRLDDDSSLNNAVATTQDEQQSFTFVGLDLACPINADDIQNRWLSSYVPGLEQTIKEYPPNVVNFMSRMLKSYVASSVSSQGWPPFVHFSQITTSDTSSYLSTCLSLVRLFANPFPGSNEVAAGTIQREMNRIYPFDAMASNMTLLAAFQAYLVYTMVLYFWLDDLPKAFLRVAMMNIQELACASSRQGLVCVAEQRSTRPKWEAWIAVEAKRRTLYTMYMFDSVLLSRDKLRNYLGTELRGLPAPANKSLWQVRVRHEWERLYNAHLTEWPRGELRIDELWPMPAGSDSLATEERRQRVDQWLEDVDEFGTMLFAVTSCTHGC